MGGRSGQRWRSPAERSGRAEERSPCASPRPATYGAMSGLGLRIRSFGETAAQGEGGRSAFMIDLQKLESARIENCRSRLLTG